MTPNAIPPIEPDPNAEHPDDEETVICPWCSGNGCGSCHGLGEVSRPLRAGEDDGWSPPDDNDYRETSLDEMRVVD